MDSKSVPNMKSSLPKQSWEIVNLVGFYYKNTNNIVANILISRAENQGNEFENCTQDVAVECDDFQVNLPVNMREKKEKKKKEKEEQQQ